MEVQNLWEDCLPREMLTVMEACADSGNIAICSHGNLIPEVIEILAKQVGIKVIGRGCEKGSVWELERTDGAWQLARYLGTFKK